MSSTNTQPRPQRPPAAAADAAAAAAAGAAATSYTKIARACATLHLITPAGYPAAITVSAATKPQEIADLLQIAGQAAAQAAAAGWAAPATIEAEPATTTQAAADPMFCGYVCSRTFDPTSGQPAWIIADGHQAHRHEKQGDAWYSYKDDAGSYNRIFVIRKGEQAGDIIWPPGQEPKPSK